MCANIGYSQPTGDIIAGWFMIRNRARVVKRHPEGDL
jgi:hypothetical protein